MGFLSLPRTDRLNPGGVCSLAASQSESLCIWQRPSADGLWDSFQCSSSRGLAEGTCMRWGGRLGSMRVEPNDLENLAQ